MKYKLENKIAVVFAASKGLGKAAAAALAREGCRIAICSRDKAAITATAESIAGESGREVFAQTVDVQSKQQIRDFITAVNSKWGQVNILVNNAGGPPVKTFEETTDEEWEKYFNITFMSTVRAIREVLPGMKQTGWGRIINITSITVKEPLPGLVYSNALRLAVVGLAKTLSRELGPYGITVHNVAPGFHRTDGLERIVRKRVENGEKREDIFKAWQDNLPLRKIGEPEDLAALITFLASDESRYMTGTTIQVDGGRYGGIL
jgi:3-oxoacyl-[acyl-carrier protein] reductase